MEYKLFAREFRFPAQKSVELKLLTPVKEVNIFNLLALGTGNVCTCALTDPQLNVWTGRICSIQSLVASGRERREQCVQWIKRGVNGLAGKRTDDATSLTLKALKYFRINHGDQRVFFKIIINVLVSFFLVYLNTCVMGLQLLYMFVLLQRGDRVDPRAVRVWALKYFLYKQWREKVFFNLKSPWEKLFTVASFTFKTSFTA